MAEKCGAVESRIFGLLIDLAQQFVATAQAVVQQQVQEIHTTTIAIATATTTTTTTLHCVSKKPDPCYLLQ